MTRRHRTAVLFLAASALVTGCGSSSDDSPTRSLASAPAADGTINVNLTEYRISATPDVALAGPVDFAVTNDGAIPHEFVVVKTVKDAAQLRKGSEADETGSIGELGEQQLRVGARQDLKLDLEAGHYALICNLPGHYQGGMHTDFVVK